MAYNNPEDSDYDPALADLDRYDDLVAEAEANEAFWETRKHCSVRKTSINNKNASTTVHSITTGSLVACHQCGHHNSISDQTKIEHVLCKKCNCHLSYEEHVEWCKERGRRVKTDINEGCMLCMFPILAVPVFFGLLYIVFKIVAFIMR